MEGMKRLPIPWMVFLLVIAHAALALSGESKKASKDKDAVIPPLPCVKWKQESRFVGFAYDHLVHLTNGCDHPVRCDVSSDVNPEPTSVTLKKGEKKSVLTFRGSPSRKFKAKVACAKQQ